MWTEKYDLNQEQREAHEKRNGTYNEFPPMWREIDAADFARSRHFMMAPVLVEYRQMMRPFGETDTTKDTPAVSAHLFWQSNGFGYAVVNEFWKGTIHFYEFGFPISGLVENFDSSD